MAAPFAGDFINDALVVFRTERVFTAKIVQVAFAGAAQKQRAQRHPVALLLQAVFGADCDVGIKKLPIGDLQLLQNLFVILVGNVELRAYLLDDPQFRAGEGAFAEQLFDGVSVHAQTDFFFLFLALDDVKRFAQIFGRFFVFPLPAGDEAFGETFLHCFVFAAIKAAQKEPGGKHHRDKADDPSAAWKPAPGGLTREKIKDVKRRKSGRR